VLSLVLIERSFQRIHRLASHSAIVGVKSFKGNFRENVVFVNVICTLNAEVLNPLLWHFHKILSLSMFKKIMKLEFLVPVVDHGICKLSSCLKQNLGFKLMLF